MHVTINWVFPPVAHCQYQPTPAPDRHTLPELLAIMQAKALQLASYGRYVQQYHIGTWACTYMHHIGTRVHTYHVRANR